MTDLIKKRAETGGHGGDLHAVAEEFGIRMEEITDFSSNINPLGPPPGLVEELSRHLPGDIVRYPDPQARGFRSALASHLRIEEQRLMVGNGASELIHLFFLWQRPPKVFLPAPSFSEYERAARVAGAVVKRFPLLPGSSPEAETIMKSISGPGVLVFCNPNNPTGFFASPLFLRELIRKAEEKEIDILLDESFFPLTGRPDGESFCRDNAPNLWVVTSLTKLWALPGLRLGFLCGPGERIKALTGSGDPWRVNALAQRAGLYCLQDKHHLQNTLQLLRKEKDFLQSELGSIDELLLFPGEANFFLLRGKNDDFSSKDLYRFLAGRGLLIRNAANFPLLNDHYFRIAVRRRDENVRLVKALREYFENRGKNQP